VEDNQQQDTLSGFDLPTEDLSNARAHLVDVVKDGKGLVHLDSNSRESIERFFSSLRQSNAGDAVGRDLNAGGAVGRDLNAGGGMGKDLKDAAYGEAGMIEERDDLNDSARAESIVSLNSSSSVTSKGASKDVRDDTEIVDDIGAHSTIRRQSVIIEGLSLEADELKKKVQTLEDELCALPKVEDLQSKLCQMETKLEETESFCYQVVEENVTLKTDIENLESEISEVQDTFRDKDAKEFKRVKWELENLSKNCRNLQIKLSKTQAKAVRLRMEKEELDKSRAETRLWAATATVVSAAALLAGVKLLSGKTN